jgi:hypothetical protein
MMGSHMSSPSSSRLLKNGATPGGLPGDGVTAAGAGAHEDEPAYQVRTVQGDQLGDLAAHGVAEDVDGRQAEAVDEAGRVGRHARNGVRGGAGAAADAGVVEQDDLAPPCQRVADGGVEVVEVAHEVLGEDQRGTRRGSEAAVGETGAADV